MSNILLKVSSLPLEVNILDDGKFPEDEYPQGRQGYLKWRTQLKLLHAQKAAEIMTLQKYKPEIIQKVKDLLIKKRTQN